MSQGYGLSVAALCAPTRRPSEARQVALYALRREAGLPLAQITRLMGLGYKAMSRRVSGRWPAARLTAAAFATA